VILPESAFRDHYKPLEKQRSQRMRSALEVIKLEPLGIVRVRGADAVKFLQGQLSNDVARLSAQRSLLAGYHNPQGRTIALIRIVQWDADDILAVVPRELATVVASRLSKFVLRAKVKIVDESAAWRVSGLVGAAPALDISGADSAGTAPARVVSGPDAAAPPTAPGVSGPDAATPATAPGVDGSTAAPATATGVTGPTAAPATATGVTGPTAAPATGVTGPTAAPATGVTGPNTAASATAPGVSGPDGAAAAGAVASGAQGDLALRDLPGSGNEQARREGALYVCVGDQPPRWLVISPADGPSLVLDCPVGNLETWQRLEVAAGQPQVYAATSEEFVAQMLNLDALNAIAFDKGCYTGQEVIARAHYRGRVKRRMQRFVTRAACQLSPGDSGQLADGRTFKVVQAARLADGRCDFLAVAPVVGAVSEPGDANSQLASAASLAPTDAATAALSVAAAPVVATLAADPATLPYPLPD
jgi:folate-binding protein YgfZ